MRREAHVYLTARGQTSHGIRAAQRPRWIASLVRRNPKHMLDNVGATHGRLRDEDEQARTLVVVEALPPAPRSRRG